jgi:hypothetical protein
MSVNQRHLRRPDRYSRMSADPRIFENLGLLIVVALAACRPTSPDMQGAWILDIEMTQRSNAVAHLSSQEVASLKGAEYRLLIDGAKWTTVGANSEYVSLVESVSSQASRVYFRMADARSEMRPSMLVEMFGSNVLAVGSAADARALREYFTREVRAERVRPSWPNEGMIKPEDPIAGQTNTVVVVTDEEHPLPPIRVPASGSLVRVRVAPLRHPCRALACRAEDQDPRVRGLRNGSWADGWLAEGVVAAGAGGEDGMVARLYCGGEARQF